tara:strand:+ start:285 stop:827 length:543 start_codon:yes stop_codon:yes gene_type:complete
MGDHSREMREAISGEGSDLPPGPRPLDVVFEIPLAPKGKQSARVTARGTYLPSGTAQWQARLALMAREHMPPEVLEGPVRVDLVCIMPRPKRLRRKSDPEGLVLWCCQKPDGDNVAKAVQDALGAKGSGFWRDDKQVVDLRVLKVYAEKHGSPRMIIRVRRPVMDPRGEIYSMTGRVPGG